MIYTVFTLATPGDPTDIRYVGMTTQTAKKRFSDILSVAKQPYCTGHNSIISDWIRELSEDGQEPILGIAGDHLDRDKANLLRIKVTNKIISTGRVLNSTHGNSKNRLIRQAPAKEPAGRKVNPQSKSAKYSVKAKTKSASNE